MNATLAQSSLGPSSPTGTKRPLPEEGELPTSGGTSSETVEGGIISQIQGGAAGRGSGIGAGERGRVLKRPRGAGPARGGSIVADGRRPSAAGEASADNGKVGDVGNGEAGGAGNGETGTGGEVGKGDGAGSGGVANNGGGDESST